MLEFALPANASGTWSVTVVGNAIVDADTDPTGDQQAPSALLDYPVPLGARIDDAGKIDTIYNAAWTQTLVSPAVDGSFAGTWTVRANGSGARSLYIALAPDVPLYPYGSGWGVEIYNVTASPLGVFRSRPGTRRAYFS
jgi:hypothetical protein